VKNVAVIVLCLLLCAACRKSAETTGTGKMHFGFSHQVGVTPLMTDTLVYSTSTLHHYKVTDLQYFISDILLYHDDGKSVPLHSGDGIHYVDIRLPATLDWYPGDELPPGNYDSLSFTFGINEVKNTSNRFPNPPERDMAWPDILGGGYHYMKMNLLYRDLPGEVTKPFMFHLGIGQVYSSAVPDPDSITGYVQNWFTVSLPVAFAVTAGVVTSIRFDMHVDHWFDGQETFDFTDYPGGIMQYQDGMHRACLNGRHVFTGREVK
jgi:hypothetical protein